MPAISKPGRACALVMAIASSTASAGQLDYTLYAGVSHSDNVNLSPSRPISQNILAPGVNFDFTQQGSTIQANVAGTLEYRDYLGSAFDNQTLAQLAGQVNWSVLPQRLDFTVQDFAGVQPLSTLSSNAPNNQQQTNVVVLGPTLYFRLGNTMRGQAELRYINSDASKTKAFNSSRGEAALRVIKDLSETDQLSANVQSQHVNFNNANAVSGTGSSLSNPDYNHNEIFGRYVSRLAHLDIDAALGWSQIDFHAAPSISSPLLRLTLGWQPTMRSNFSITASRRYSDAAADMIMPVQTRADAGARIEPTPFSPLGINTGDSVINSEVYLDRRLEGTYAFSTDRLALTVSPLYSHRSYLNDPSFDQTARGASGGLNYRLSERLSLLALADTERLTYRVLQRRDRTSDYEIGLNARETPHWSYRITLTHRQRHSTAAGEGYSENEIYFGVEFRR